MPKQLGGKATSKRPATKAAVTKRPAAKAAATKPQASKAAATKRPASKAAAMKRPAASQELGKKDPTAAKAVAKKRPAAGVQDDSPRTVDIWHDSPTTHFDHVSPMSLPDDLSAALHIEPRTPEQLLSVAMRHLREQHGLSDQQLCACLQQLCAWFETGNNDPRS